jgi:hypothetical protein
MQDCHELFTIKQGDIRRNTQEAAKGLRRLKACKQLPMLRAALAAHQNKHALDIELEPNVLAA